MPLPAPVPQMNCSYRVSLSTNRFSQEMEYRAIVVFGLEGLRLAQDLPERTTFRVLRAEVAVERSRPPDR